MAIATILMYHGTKILNYKYLAYIFTILLVVIIGVLIIKTFKAIRNREICIYEEH
jgi:tellurite resistance protein TehA-like permease